MFQKANVLDLERHQTQEINEYIGRLQFDPDQAAELMPKLIERYTISAPEIELGKELQPSSQKERTVEDDGRFSPIPFPQRYKVMDITYEISARGDLNLLDFAPPSYTYSFSSSPPERRGNKIIFTYSLAVGADPGQIESRLTSDVRMLKQNVEGLQQWVSNWNASLEGRLKSALARRTNELRQQKAMSDRLTVRLEP